MPEAPKSEDEPSTVGWDAITALLKRRYPAQEPRHWGTLLSFRIGGSDPLEGISACLHVNEPDHWHFVSYGMSELYAKEWDDKRTSGWGFEFTFRLKREPGEAEPPQWPLSLLQNLARYVFNSGNVFAPGHYLPLNGPIALEKTTAIWAAMFVEDPELKELDTPNGSLRFLELVGLTLDELAAIRAWDGERFAELLRQHNPLFVTDLTRQSVLLNAEIARAVEQGTAQNGTSSAGVAVRELNFSDTLAKRRFLV